MEKGLKNNGPVNFKVGLLGIEKGGKSRNSQLFAGRGFLNDVIGVVGQICTLTPYIRVD